MGDVLDIRIEGVEDFVETVDKMIQGLHPDKIEPILNKGAKTFAKEIRARAPVGPTGNLKKAVKTKKLKRWGGPAPSIAAIDRKKAPHAWLVIHGTSGVRQVNPPRLVTIDGRPALITNTGVMPPNRFFDDAVEAKSGDVLSGLEKDISALIEEAIK